MPERYVLLRHECPNGVPKPSHWDFMLESEDVLHTWELQKLPDSWSHALGLATAGNALGKVVGVPAIRLADHRLDYLDYEGPLTGDRGHVERVDHGQLVWVERSTLRIVVEFQDGQLFGQAILSNKSNSWLLEVPR